jgi:hypothetical protein
VIHVAESVISSPIARETSLVTVAVDPDIWLTTAGTTH